MPIRTIIQTAPNLYLWECFITKRREEERVGPVRIAARTRASDADAVLERRRGWPIHGQDRSRCGWAWGLVVSHSVGSEWFLACWPLWSLSGARRAAHLIGLWFQRVLFAQLSWGCVTSLCQLFDWSGRSKTGNGDRMKERQIWYPLMVVIFDVKRSPNARTHRVTIIALLRQNG